MLLEKIYYLCKEKAEASKDFACCLLKNAMNAVYNDRCTCDLLKG